jgi:hypothetical protein
MPDGIDPPMYDMQSTQLDPVIDRATAYAHLEQLPAGNHTVLALREVRDPPIERLRPRFAAYDRANLCLIAHAAKAST